MLAKVIIHKLKAKYQKQILKMALLIGFCVFPFASNAQCAMCRASLESTGDTAQAEAVNDGIVYLMAIPYILVALVGYYIYRMYNKKKKS